MEEITKFNAFLDRKKDEIFLIDRYIQGYNAREVISEV